MGISQSFVLGDYFVIVLGVMGACDDVCASCQSVMGEYQNFRQQSKDYRLIE
jgi:hypothetical protein